MAEVQEAKPTSSAKRYRTTLDLGSASTWKKWNLEVFNAKFIKDQYHDLSNYLDEIYKMPPLEGHDAESKAHFMTTITP